MKILIIVASLLASTSSFAFPEATIKGNTVVVTNNGKVLFTKKFDTTEDYDKREPDATYGEGYKRLDQADFFGNCLIVKDSWWGSEAHAGGVRTINIYNLKGKEVISKITPNVFFNTREIQNKSNTWSFFIDESEGMYYTITTIDDSCRVKNHKLKFTLYSDDAVFKPKENVIEIWGKKYFYTISKDGSIKHKKIDVKSSDKSKK